MPVKKNPLTSTEMKEFFSALPPVVKEAIQQSGIQFESIDHLRTFVKNLERK
jgi:hypothetical protein